MPTTIVDLDLHPGHGLVIDTGARVGVDGFHFARMVLKRGLVGVAEQDNPRDEGIQILYPVGHLEQEVGRAAEMAKVVRARPVFVAPSE